MGRIDVFKTSKLKPNIRGNKMEAQTMTKPFHIRMRTNAKPRHLRNVLKYAAERFGAMHSEYEVQQNWENEQGLVALASRYPGSQIDQAHAAVCATYEQGHRWQKKGRTKGSLNRQTIQQWEENNGQREQQRDASQEMLESLLNKATEIMESHKEDAEDASENASEGQETAIAGDYVTKRQFRAYTDDNDERVADLVLKSNKVKEQVNILDQFTAKNYQSIDNLAAKVEALESRTARVIEIKRPEIKENLNLGVQHRQFATLLRASQALNADGSHINIWIYGPAGTGKSTAAENVAKALGLAFHTNGKLTSDFQIMGYNDAHGRYVRTQFREAYEHGGVYLADEIDGSLPDALIGFNGALANGHMAFADKVITRHKDFIFIGAANTTGLGGTIEYVGRMKQDAAFNDRFGAWIEWPIDEALETSLCDNAEWLALVRKVRANIQRNGIKGHLVTPRATIYGCSLLRAGFTIEETAEMSLRKGLNDAQWRLCNQ